VTRWLDAPICFDPQGEGVNPAIEYLAWVAWGDDLENRERFNAAIVSAFFRQDGKQVPQPVPRVKGERIGPTVEKGARRLHRKIPAALLVLNRWAETGHHDLSGAGLTIEQQARLCAMAAAYRRQPAIMPARVGDIGHEIWRDARPTLGMMLALPVNWGLVANAAAVHAAVVSLCRHPSWVPDAIRNALALAVRIELMLDPPTLLAPRPRLLRGRGRWIAIRQPRTLCRLMGLPAA
jgi:hypothetical protein